ncbi:unnamed protein product [Leptidea sinapis]|uniref:Uncharacterized protein n=1 Tax=Leptidea sinapis TaxID=189913 RepID=A0A5E4QGV1_9NEOP|nr:unnamed protein product [Leptidea sinapis]
MYLACGRGNTTVVDGSGSDGVRGSRWSNDTRIQAFRIGLLDTCINLCLTNTSQLDNLTKLKLLWLVLKKSSGNCQLILHLRDSLVGLKKCLLRVEQDKKVQDYLLLFRILHVAISVHHPLGKLSSEEGSMANNWVDWNKCKLSILEIVCLEMSFVHRSTKQSAYCATQYCDSFYVVSALIYYQVFNEDMQHRIDEISENAPKRQKRKVEGKAEAIICSQRLGPRNTVHPFGSQSPDTCDFTMLSGSRFKTVAYEVGQRSRVKPRP